MPLHILLADDSVPAQNMGKKILVDAGYEVLTVSNGLEALRRIAEAAPDIAILDIFMPGYTGLEICERLRANPATATLPVILTVGKLEPYRPSDGESVRSNAVIVKPFASAELVSAVHNLIGDPRPVQVRPEPAAEPPAVEPVADPAQENHAAAGVPEPPAPATAVPSAPPEQPLEGLAEEPPDEPLFSYGDFAADDAAPEVPPEPSVYAAEPLVDGGEPGGTENLIFNPDAEHTPFSASAADQLPPASQLAAAEDESRFSEFDLEVDATHYAAGPEPEFSTMEEPVHPLPASGVQLEVVADAEPAGPELPAIAPGPTEATDEASSGAPEMLELELPALEVAEIDPALEVQEAAAVSGVAAIGEDTSQGSETSPERGAPTQEKDAATASAAQLAGDEEARRLAFEALFNSTDPIPLEEDSAPTAAAEPVMDALPSIADLSENEADNIAPDSELETLSNDDQPASMVAESDPYLLEEEQPLNAIGKIPDRDPLLDDGLASNWGSESPSEPQDASASAKGKISSPQPEEGSDLIAAASAEAIEVETAQPSAEPHAEALEVLEVAPTIESVPAVPEAVAEPVPSAAEAIEVETAQPSAEPHAEALEVLEVALTTEDVPTVPEAVAEPVPSAAEAIEVEAAQPSAESHAEALEVLEVAPTIESVLTVPEAVAEPVPAEVAHPAAATPLHATSSTHEVSPRSSEAERIHQAVERVFDRFKPVLVAAIVRELARRD